MPAPDRGAPSDDLASDTRVSHSFLGALEGALRDTIGVSGVVSSEEQGRVVRIPGASDFELGRRLGHGGMGVVWEARQRSLDRAVAMKTLHPGLEGGMAAERFAAEALVVGRLEHPNIVPVHTYGLDEGGHPYLCMKVVRGVEWARLLEPSTEEEQERAERIDLRGHLRILVRVCEAVRFAHSRGVVHRDIKPANVMIGEFGEVVLTDWGLALELGKGTGRGGLVGTPAYLAPEMAACDEGAMGPWTDVYLLGATLYEVLTGSPPHRGKTVKDAVEAARAGRIEPPSERAPEREIPAELVGIALRALDPEPGKRYGGVGEIEAAIEEYLQNEASSRLSGAALSKLERCQADVAEGSRAASEIYGEFAEVVSELGQALALWAGNGAAAEGLRRARLSCAGFAIGQDDPAVAEAQIERLGEGEPGVAEMRGRIVALRESHAAESRRRRRLRYSLAAATVAALVGLALGLLQTRRVRNAEAVGDRRKQALAMAEGAGWKEPADQVGLLRQAIAVDPTWHEGYAELSAAHLKHALSLAERDPQACATAIEASRGVLETVLAVSPDYDTALYYRGYSRQMLGEAEGALADHRRAAAVAPDSHDGLAAATVLALAEGRFAEAARVATLAIETPGDEDDQARRAIARFVRGDLEGALRDVESAEAILPAQADYDAFTALFLMAQGRMRAAAERLVSATRAHPRSPHITPLLAYLAARRGEPDEARALETHARAGYAAYARCYLDLDPVNRSLVQAPPPRDVLGRAFVLEQDLTRITPSQPSAGARLRRRGEELFARGQAEPALAFAEQALADDPADGLARLLLARCLAKLGHVDAARDELAIVPGLAPDRAPEAEALLRALGDVR